MESLSALLDGFSTALTLQYLAYALIGCLLGTAIGVIPGLGPVGGVAILIPLSYNLDLTGAVIMLAAIYYGVMYGGSITSILMNVPGEPTSAVTCLDGYPMAQQGRAGTALAISAIASFIAGTSAVVFLVLIGPPAARWALAIGPPELFAVMLLSFLLVAALAGSSFVKAAIVAVFGLVVGLVGLDPAVGVPRYTLGQSELLAGPEIVSVFMGLFGLGEILISAEQRYGHLVSSERLSLIPKMDDLRQSALPIIRGTIVGIMPGLVPGVGASAPTFVAYAVEKKLAKDPTRFGRGAIEGVAAPEAANNAYSISALIPLLTLGIPGSATVAVLTGAFLVHGITPGPFLFRDHPEIVWPIIASLYIGNVILLVLNLPLVRVWILLLRIPYPVLMSIILAFMVVGAYSMTNSTFSILTLLIFGVVGYGLRKLGMPLGPFALTFIIGTLMEKALRRSLEMSQGDVSIFVTRPISGTILGIGLLAILIAAFWYSRARLSRRFQSTIEPRG